MRIPSIQLKAAALVPMPRVRQRIARIEKPGLRRSIRKPKRRVLKKLVGPSPNPLFSRDFLGLFDSAELTQRRVTRFVRQHSRRDVSLGQKIEMRLNLFRHLGVALDFWKQSEQPRKTRRAVAA